VPFSANFEVEKNKKYALVFGNEVHGVSQAVALCDGCIEIPVRH
jgi:tRNA G18 (ribose-2'-O)-methylase SpoU